VDVISTETDNDSNSLNNNGVASFPIGNLSHEVSSSEKDTMILTSPLKKGRKRQRNEDNWKRNIVKKLRNEGKLYESHIMSKKMRKERQMKSPCKETCKLKCASKFAEEDRKKLFSEF